MPINPVPNGYHTITPYLVVNEAAQLIEFLKSAFDAELTYRMDAGDGTITHAEVRVGDSMLMIADAPEEYTPKPCMLYLYLPDVDTYYRRAMEAGAESLAEPSDQYYGDRTAGIRHDTSGVVLYLGMHIEDVSEEEMLRRHAERTAG